jgi:glycosyltransferase involved in cell wall biosynthesis
MHVMFIHPNFPAQFGQVAERLAKEQRWQVTFVTSVDTTHLQLPFNHINYKVQEGPQPKEFFNPTNLQGLMDHLFAVYAGLRSVPQLKPDLVIGHMSYGTMLYLRNLYNCPFVGYYEMLPAPFWTDGLVLRKEFPPPEIIRLFNATYHALTYLHLHAVDAVYTPTQFQMSTAPAELQHKMRVIFDGVDTNVFQKRELPRPVQFRNLTIDADTRVVTYVSRGLESVRGFDLFMKAAQIIAKEMPNVLFLIAGDERTNYGHELHHLRGKSFKQYVLEQADYDPSRFHFLGLIPPPELLALYSLSDVHFYLTVPFVLSWSLMQALASECTVVGSATSPVQEVIDDGVHGLLADFYDVEGLAERALRVLRNPGEYRHLGQAARQRVLERYDRPVCHNQLVQFFQSFYNKAMDKVFANLFPS